MRRIIYPNKDGGIAIIIPSSECLESLSIEAIAMKDVPFGLPYKIIDTADLPADRTFRAAWEADFSKPDGAGADYGVGSERDVVAWNEDGSPVVKEVEE